VVPDLLRRVPDMNPHLAKTQSKWVALIRNGYVTEIYVDLMNSL